MSKSVSRAAADPPTRQAIIAEARQWIGTPFHWQASVKRHGCDCKGLVAGVARELGMPEGESLAALEHSYRQDFDPDQLFEGLGRTLVRIDEDKLQPGDILAIAVPPKSGPRHLAILTGAGRMVHCYGMGHIRKVIEAPIGRNGHRIHSFWTWPSLGPSPGRKSGG